jgi:hypothetical protein
MSTIDNAGSVDPERHWSTTSGTRAAARSWSSRNRPGWPPENSFQPSSNPVLRFVHKLVSTIGIEPSTGADFIKRVIGLPCDHVVCCNARHEITVNGKALDCRAPAPVPPR